jgi:hypothetical protein
MEDTKDEYEESDSIVQYALVRGALYVPPFTLRPTSRRNLPRDRGCALTDYRIPCFYLYA